MKDATKDTIEALIDATERLVAWTKDRADGGGAWEKAADAICGETRHFVARAKEAIESDPSPAETQMAGVPEAIVDAVCISTKLVTDIRLAEQALVAELRSMGNAIEGRMRALDEHQTARVDGFLGGPLVNPSTGETPAGGADR